MTGQRRPASGTEPRASQQVEQRFRAAANMLAGYVYEARFLPVADRARHEIIWASDGFEQIFGRSIGEYNREQHWRAFYHSDEVAAAQARTDALLRGEPVESDVRVLRPDGSLRWLRISNRPIIDPVSGSVTGVLGLGMDITERKLAEQAVKKSELVLRSLTCNAPDWLLLLNADFTVQFLNRNFLDHTPAEWLGREPFDAFDDLQRRRARSVLTGVMNTRQPAEFELQLGPSERGFHYEVSVAPVIEEAQVSGLTLRISDVTERRRLAGTLQTHATILQTMREGVLVFDPAGNIRFFNPAACQMFAYQGPQFGKLKVAHLGIDVNLVLTALADDSPAAGEQELTCLRGDATQFVGAFIFNRITLHGLPMLIGVVKDMTGRKLLERQVADMSSREQQRIADDLHDGVSQELTGVALLLRLLAERIARDFPAASHSIEEVIGLVNDAIHSTRTLARGLAPVEIDRGGLASALTFLAADAREAHGLDVRFQMHAAGDEALEPDVAEHLYRIAQEALGNAVRHAKPRSIAIELRTKRGAVRLCVDDDGCGVAGGYEAGTGLGMRVMQYRAQLIGARLSVRSAPGGGTRVLCHWVRSRGAPLGRAPLSRTPLN